MQELEHLMLDTIAQFIRSTKYISRTRSSNVCFRFPILTVSKTFLSEVNKSVPFNSFRAPNKLN